MHVGVVNAKGDFGDGDKPSPQGRVMSKTLPGEGRTMKADALRSKSWLVVVLERCWSRRVNHPLLERRIQGRKPLLGRLARPWLVRRPCALATNSGSG